MHVYSVLTRLVGPLVGQVGFNDGRTLYRIYASLGGQKKIELNVKS